MEGIIENIYQIQQKYKKIAICCSGGVDSMVLMHLCHSLGIRDVILINHNIRPESCAEYDEIINFLKINYNINIYYKEVKVNFKEGKSFETEARKARYNAFCEIAISSGFDCLLLAHHRDDQVETFFMRLERGSGLDGLCSMQYESVFEGITFCRPMLNMSSKVEIRDFAAQNNIRYWEDSTNQDTSMQRNHLRHLMSQYSPKDKDILDKRIISTVEHLQALQSSTKWLLQNYLDSITINKSHDHIEIQTPSKEVFHDVLLECIMLITPLPYKPRKEKFLNCRNRVSEAIHKDLKVRHEFHGIRAEYVPDAGIIIISHLSD